MNKRIKTIELILSINFAVSVLLSSFGREVFIIQFVNYYFWLSLGLIGGFLVYKYEVKRMWKKEKEEDKLN